MQVSLTLKSRNAKTGDIPVSTTSAKSCPSGCVFNGNGCYAESGPLAIWWRKVTNEEAGETWADFIAAVADLPAGILWRHNQAGDLPGNKIKINAGAVAKLVVANAGKRGFTYTHYDALSNASNRATIAKANAAGFTINLSGNNLEHADKLAELAIGPVVVVLPADAGSDKRETPAGRTVITCTATYRDDVTCKSCGLCAIRDRQVIIGFPAHGANKRKVSALAA